MIFSVFSVLSVAKKTITDFVFRRFGVWWFRGTGGIVSGPGVRVRLGGGRFGRVSWRGNRVENTDDLLYAVRSLSRSWRRL